MRTRTASLLIAVCLAVSCGGDGPTTPTDPLSRGSATVDGQAFQSSPNGRSAIDRGSNVIDINLSDCRAGAVLNFTIQGPLAVGTVAPARLDALYFDARGQWNYVRNQGRGSLILTSVSPRIVGTFEFDMSPLATTGATGTKYVQGSFDVMVGNGTACQ